ncbi:hypothetical protein AN232_02720 [Citrobacter sp. CRE-46]|nr:hypothetical protein AN232_02720 [Citrobacter sp. CRE-46]
MRNAYPAYKSRRLLAIQNNHTEVWLELIPVILHVADALATFTHPGHIAIYAPGDSLTCRLPATRII